MADLAHRAAMETRIEREMGRLSDRQRRRLVELLGEPPDPANVPEEFWQDVEAERRRELAALLLLLFLLGARQHGAEDRTKAAAAGAEYAQRRAAEVASQWTQASRETLNRHGREWRARGGTITGVIVGPPENKGIVTKRDARAAAADVFAPARDENLAITETTAAGTAGSEWAVAESGGQSDEDRWITEKDSKVCPVCQPLHRKPRSEWQAKFPEGPPAHPRCRCFLDYANVRTRGVAPAGVL